MHQDEGFDNDNDDDDDGDDDDAVKWRLLKISRLPEHSVIKQSILTRILTTALLLHNIINVNVCRCICYSGK